MTTHQALKVDEGFRKWYKKYLERMTKHHERILSLYSNSISPETGHKKRSVYKIAEGDGIIHLRLLRPFGQCRPLRPLPNRRRRK